MGIKYLFAVCALLLTTSNICNAQIICQPPNYYSQRVSVDSLDKLFSKRIPAGLEVRDCTVEDLTEHHWLHYVTDIFKKSGGYIIISFYKRGKYVFDWCGSDKKNITYRECYYLSDTPDLMFDKKKTNNKSGKYLILKIDGKNNNGTYISRIVKCADGTLLEIYDNPCLDMCTYKPLKEPYKKVIKNGYLTIPFEDYGFVVWECSKE